MTKTPPTQKTDNLAKTPAIDISKAKPETLSQTERRLKEIERQQTMQKQFSCEEDGIYFLSEGNEPFFICSPVTVLARTREKYGKEWGQLVSFEDDIGDTHELTIPRTIYYKNDTSELCRLLVREGMDIELGLQARRLLLKYLKSQLPHECAIVVDRIGWYDEKTFVLPDRVIGGSPLEKIIYKPTQNLPSYFKTSGTLDQWRDNLGRYCVGNSRLVFAVSSAFAAPLLKLLKMESCGIHFMGISSQGKSTLLRAATSVPGVPEYMKSWRATTNGLEASACAHNDTLFVLDEIAQANPKIAGEAAYLLGNGTGKQRANISADSCHVKTWRILLLSSGEVDLGRYLASEGKSSSAGQDVRLVSIPADAQKGYGAFEDIHGFTDAGLFADMMKGASTEYYGTAFQAFTEHLIKALGNPTENIIQDLKDAQVEFIRGCMPPDADSQVRRVARRFALIACVGELAAAWGITGWPEGEATQAARTCLEAWINERGGVGLQEHRMIVKQIRLFFEQHGEDRFTDWLSTTNQPTRNRVGYKRVIDGTLHFYVLPQSFEKELCGGYHPKLVIDVCIDAGMLVPSNEKSRIQKSIRLPGSNRIRVYHFNSSALNEAETIRQGQDE